MCSGGLMGVSIRVLEQVGVPHLQEHHVDLAKVQTQQENRLWPFFSALESFFFAGLSEWNLKKIWKIQKNYSHTNSEWF
jgi:hypothetical protein